MARSTQIKSPKVVTKTMRSGQIVQKGKKVATETTALPSGGKKAKK